MLREQDKRVRKAGIIGTGRIANRFMPEVRLVCGISLEAAYNPHEESVERFGVKWGIETYTDLQDFFQAVELVYVASSHETHYSYVKAALENGKHVLCEKPLTFQRKQAEELFEYADAHDLILFEGIKTAYCPGFRKVLELADCGTIGTIRCVDACFTRLTSEDSRELTDLVYGGSFTELGSYCLLPIVKLLGDQFDYVQFDSIRGENGLDLFTKASFRYSGGLASATCGLGVKAEGRLLLSGTKGYILAEAPWWKTSNIEVHYENPLEIERYSEPFPGDGLRYEITSFLDMVNGDRKQGLLLTPGESGFIADIMEQFMQMERRK